MFDQNEAEGKKGTIEKIWSVGMEAFPTPGNVVPLVRPDP